MTKNPTPDTSEKKIQKNCIALLESMGYSYVNEEDNKILRKQDLNSVIFKDILAKQLDSINRYTYNKQSQHFSNEEIQKAIDELDIALNEGLQKANEKITDLLLLGTSFEKILPDGSKKSFSFRYIDFENLDNNTYHITEEFSVEKIRPNNDIKHRRVDMVLFINGIPLVAIELKKSLVNYENGIKQLLKEQRKEEIPHLFKFIQLCIAGNENEARYGTSGTNLEQYSIWREESSKDTIKNLVQNREITQLDRTLFSLLEKERLLRLVRHYIFFDNGVKKVCRYQQFFAVEKTLQRVEKLENGKRAGGLIWHTQGSGKSLTMVLLSRLLKLSFVHAKIIVVTDRVDLDEQIHKVFAKAQIQAFRANSGGDLLRKLKSGVGVITTLVHKFEKLRNEKYSINDNTIFVLVDESHRTQNGDLHKAMKKALPNACYIGFTGTPLLKKDKNTLRHFGGEIHRYSIESAVQDKAVLPLYYESRFVEQDISNEDGLNMRFEHIARNLKEEQKRDLQNKWARFSKISSSEQRQFIIANDINEHFRTYLQGTGFKAMFATNSKFEAMRYYELFKEFGDIRAFYVISHNDSDELDGGKKEEVFRHYSKLVDSYGGLDEYLTKVKNEFIYGEEVDLLIVVDKLLTGFDVPKAKVLYIDKELKEHNLLQAIARVNRLCEGKDFGLIIDYRGLLGELDRTLSAYSALEGFEENDIAKAVINIAEEIQKSRECYEKLENLFCSVRFKKDMQSYLVVLESEKIRQEFKEVLSQFARAFALALSSERCEEILSEAEIKEYKKKIRFYNELRKLAQIRFYEAFDFGKYEVQMQKLLDTFIGAKKVQKITPLINILDKDFDRQIDSLQDKNIKADSILSALSAFVQSKIQSNPAFYESIAQQIKEIMLAYKAKRISAEEKLLQVEKLKNNVLEREGKKFDDKLETKFAKAVCENLGVFLKGVDIKEIENLSKKINEVYKEYRKRPEWHSNSDIAKEIENKLEDMFWDISDEYDIKIDIDKIFKILQKMAGFTQ